MALMIGKSPLARPPGGKFNFEIERLPRHLLYLEDFEKRIRGRAICSRSGACAEGRAQWEDRCGIFLNNITVASSTYPFLRGDDCLCLTAPGGRNRARYERRTLIEKGPN